MSAPAAKTFSPPYRITARTDRFSAASVAAACRPSWTSLFSAFMGGRSSRMVPMPSSTSRRTNFPTINPPAPAYVRGGAPDPQDTLGGPAGPPAGCRLGVELQVAGGHHRHVEVLLHPTPARFG